MSSSQNDSRIHQPENSNRENKYSDQLTLRSPNLRDYFERNEDIRNK